MVDCPLILEGDRLVLPAAVRASDTADVCRLLERGCEQERIEAMTAAIARLSAASPTTSDPANSTILMAIIRFVMPNQKCKLLKKLVLLFFELIPKTDADGALLSEMILLCNALRSDLQHPNEYVRGSSLRFLTRIREAEILEPLMPSVRACLEHRHPYVRRNAINAVLAIYQACDYLIPDAPEVIASVLAAETDAACRRNAFWMLALTDEARAAHYFATAISPAALVAMDGHFQLAVIAYIKMTTAVPKGCAAAPSGGAGAEGAQADPVRARYIACMAAILQAPASQTLVKFEAASSLIALTASPPAIRAVAACYIELAIRETDNSVKLVILERFAALQRSHAALANEPIMEVVRILSASDVAVRQAALAILTEGICARSAADLIALLVKELARIDDYDAAPQYRKALLAAIDVSALRFPSVAPTAMACFVDLIKESSSESPILNDAIRFIKEMLERLPHLQQAAIEQLLSALAFVTDARAAASLLWILGEFCTDLGTIHRAMGAILTSLGSLPIVESESRARLLREGADDSDEQQQQQQGKSPLAAHLPAAAKSKGPQAAGRVNADGTYATQSALLATTTRPKRSDPSEGLEAGDDALEGQALRRLLLGSNYNVAVALAASLTKMAIHGEGSSSAATPPAAGPFSTGSGAGHGTLRGQAMLICTSLLRLGLSLIVKSQIDKDSYDRIMLFLRVLVRPCPALEHSLAVECRRAFDAHLRRMDSQRGRTTASHKATFASATPAAGGVGRVYDENSVDGPITFRPGQRWAAPASGTADDGATSASVFVANNGVCDADLRAATRDANGGSLAIGSLAAVGGDHGVPSAASGSLLSRVIQLTGFSDEIYGETYVTINHSDIILDIMLVSQVDRTLQGVTVDLSTSGDLSLGDKPGPVTMTPNGYAILKASVKVKATANGSIYGSISYSGSANASDYSTIVLSTIPVDICEYIRPRTVPDGEFRRIWTLLEWENKINVAPIRGTSLAYVMDAIMAGARLACITPNLGISASGDYLAANMYAQSTFGEEILANVCLERLPATSPAASETISGHLRLRSKTQGIAVALGDRITEVVGGLSKAT